MGERIQTSEQAGSMVKVISSDGVIFEISQDQARQSVYIEDMMNVDTDEVIPLPNVKSAELQTVIDYMKHHEKDNGFVEIQKPLKSNDLKENGVSEFDAALINIRH